MTPDPDLTGPPEYQPDEEPAADDIGVLFAAAAYEMTTWEWIREQEAEWENPLMCVACRGIDWTEPHQCQGGCACFCQVGNDG